MTRKPLFALTLLLIFAAGGHAAVRVWSGASDGFWTNSGNWGGTAPVAGDDLSFPVSPSRLTATNNFPASTLFNSISFSGANYVVGGNLLILGHGLTNS